MTDCIVTLNAGSSSLKFSVYPTEVTRGAELRGKVERIGIAPRLEMAARDGRRVARDLPRDAAEGHRGALDAALAEIAAHDPQARVVAVSHRIVHGGPERTGSVRLDPATLAQLETYAPFAPLHQPNNLAAARAATAVFPDALQVGCFDTAFHRNHPWVNDVFALPRRFYEAGVRRYGFHGLSYTYIAERLAAEEPALFAGNTVVAHLGNGASMCALKGGRSLASTMGFSALDGLPMGTRCGQLDPGVLLYMLTELGMDADAIAQLLYTQSGLLGLSGLSSDMRTLEASDDPRAAEAIDYFVFRNRRELGALAASLGGLDGVVFTGGIGENSALVRARICEGMEWAGLVVDDTANAASAREISTSASGVRILCIPTDEESILARDAAKLLGRC